MSDRAPPAASTRVLVLACAAILLTAADTYVVVLALPEMMAGVGLTSAELPRAAPIVSLFLLGYIAVLPLLGRVSDDIGRRPVLLACLAIFAVGSGITAAADELSGVVFGRFLQGLGGGGLVPVTLALVADRWPEGRRGVPLGAVGAVQELGSVIGPLYGAAIIAVGGWRAIFWLNLVIAAVVALPLGPMMRHEARGAADRGSRPRDRVGLALLIAAGAAITVAAFPPAQLARDLTWGVLAEPLPALPSALGWLSPLAVVALALCVALVVQQRRATHPLLRPALASSLWRRYDGPGTVLMAAGLGLVVLALASPDPETQTLNDGGGWMLAGAAALTVAFVLRERAAGHPLIPLSDFAPSAAWGSHVVSLFIGAALIAALVDVPLYARATAFPYSQLDAALVLMRLLVGLPIGALLGGLTLRRVQPALPASIGCAMAAVGLWLIAGWSADELLKPGAIRASDVELFVTGLGLGLAVAPVTDAALRVVSDGLHGLVSSLVVVARSAGMLLGLSALTALGVARFRDAVAALPPATEVCPGSPLDCPDYTDELQAALLDQLGVIFTGASICAAIAAVLAAVLLRTDHRVGRARATIR